MPRSSYQRAAYLHLQTVGFSGRGAHRLLAGPEGRRQGLAQAQTPAEISRMPGLQRDITHYKKDRLHTVYIARSRRHLSGPNLNDQQSACRV
jgi:hypothetical protein